MTKQDQALYTAVGYEVAQHITERYSTSFSRAIRSLSKEYRPHIYAVYSMVRLGDEIVDAGFTIDTAATLDRFEADVKLAIEQRYSTNPALHAFALTVHKHRIPLDLITSFIASMRMDITKRDHTKESYKSYIYGSAEVVGLMCLAIFCDGDTERYHRLTPAARALGSAFQKVNFLRDLHADGIERGRVYFPGIDLNVFTDVHKRAIEEEIAAEYTTARAALPELPRSAARGIAAALAYYEALLSEIRAVPAAELLHRRIRVPDYKKAAIAAKLAISELKKR